MYLDRGYGDPHLGRLASERRAHEACRHRTGSLMRSTILRIALAAILAAAGIGCGVAVGSGGPSQGSALPRVLGQLDHGAHPRPACETVEAATFLSGGETLPEAQVAALARERFSHRAEAER